MQIRPNGGGGYLTRKTQKAQKSYASGSPPFGEDGRGLFPLGEDLGEAVEGLGVGSISHGKHRKHRKHSHKERPQLPFPSPRRGGGRGGECKLTSQSFNCFTPPLTPPLKREGKGSCKGGERMLRTGCFRTHLVPLFHLPYDTRFYAAWSIGRFSVECKPILRGV